MTQTVHANVHGIEVGYTFEGTDPLGGFFAPFERGDDGGPDRLSVDIQRVAGVPAHADDGWRPIFFYGRVQAYAGEQGLLLLNGEGVARVSLDGERVRIETSGNDELTEGLFHVAMLWALRARGFYDVHAAAVVPPGGPPLVLAGDSGVGKTTWMLAFIEAGSKYLGDDRVLVRRGRVYGYPRAFHLGPATLEAFRAYDGVPLPDGGKRRIAPRVDRYDAGGSPPAVLLFPQIADNASSSVRPLSEAEAFGRLLVASALVAVDGIPHRDEQLACLRELVVRTPCYELIGGRDVLESPVLAAERVTSELFK